jgi:hypothetical protein
MKVHVEIPNRSIWSLVSLLFVGAFTYLQAVGYLIPGFHEIISLKRETTSISQIGLVWVPIITYVLISTMICFTWRIFKSLKELGEDGLIMNLMVNLVVGMPLSIIVGFVLYFLLGFNLGLIVSFNICFSILLLSGLVWGIKKELE